MTIRKLEKSEYGKAATLSLEVYNQCSANDFDDEGLEAFKSFIFSPQLMEELAIYGAFEEDCMIGIIGLRPLDKHISLFFVRKEYHRRGIGKLLFDSAYKDCPAEEITVNSSTYAFHFYERLGFIAVGEKQVSHGITSIPMKRTACKSD